MRRTDTMSGDRGRDLPPPQAHRSAGTRLLIAIVIVLFALFALVIWSRYHQTQQPPSAPMHQSSQVFEVNRAV